MIQLDLSQGLNPQVLNTLIDEAEYQNYRFNRIKAPDIPVSSWGLIFDNVEALEERYIQEMN